MGVKYYGGFGGGACCGCVIIGIRVVKSEFICKLNC